ncbi:RelE-like toxin protein [Klebsiella pneumoniae]|nr:RelE-like toxin protein [Klebsiella pneumoniae]
MFSVFYHPEAREEATALPVKIRVKFDRLIGKLEYDARLLREPDTKPLGDGLFEIRTMGTDIARGIWVYHKGNTIIMLRVFIKKSQKTPAKEIDLAKKRLAEVLNELVSHKECITSGCRTMNIALHGRKKNARRSSESYLRNGVNMTT